MSNNRKTIVTVSADMRIHASAQDIWPQLCPVREYDWIKGWACEMVHSDSGINELGCIFQTGSRNEGDLDTWVTSRFDPVKRMEFIRTNSKRVIRYEILLAPDEKTTRMTWIQHISPLNKEGEEFVKSWPTTFKQHMGMVEKMLNHFLATGTMLQS